MQVKMNSTSLNVADFYGPEGEMTVDPKRYRIVHLQYDAGTKPSEAVLVLRVQAVGSNALVTLAFTGVNVLWLPLIDNKHQLYIGNNTSRQREGAPVEVTIRYADGASPTLFTASSVRQL
jgi:hypothetical protein